MNGTQHKRIPASISKQWLCLLVALLPCISTAAEYALVPAIDIETLYNDNLRLTNPKSDAVTGIIVSPRFNFTARMPTWQWEAKTELRDKQYRGIEGLDTTDQTINLSSLHQTERYTLQFRGGRLKESLLTSEFIDADTGLIKTQTDRTSDIAGVTWTWSATEQDQVKLDYRYTDAVYDHISGTGLYDYSQHGPSLTLSHSPSKRTQFFLQASNSIYSVPELDASLLGKSWGELFYGGVYIINDTPHDVGLESSTNNLQVGASYMISETISGNIGVGTYRTSSDTLIETCTNVGPPYTFPPAPIPIRAGFCNAVSTDTRTTTNHGQLYNASLTKKTETVQLTVSASRSIEPSGSATQVENETFSLSAQWYKTERLAFSISGANIDVRALESSQAYLDRRYYAISPHIQWRSSSNSMLSLSYSYRHLAYTGAANAIISQQVSAVFNYAWDKMSISR